LLAVHVGSAGERYVAESVEAVVDLTALEHELCRIPEVTAARVVAGATGDIEEVHILSLPLKHAKQVVRDVQSVAMASFGLDLDRRIVSVVQLDAVTSGSVTTARDDDDPQREANGDIGLDDVELEPPGGHRINVDTVSAVRRGLQCTAQVVLSRDDERATGTAEGIVATGSVLRLVAQATIAALRQLETAAARADVESAAIVNLGTRQVALTTVVLVVPPYEEVCAGAAVVRTAGELDAVARAVLAATNRRLPQLR
jgi:hypothetical protein